MTDLIRREDVAKTIQHICDLCGEQKKYDGIMCGSCYLDSFVLDDIPSADPERKWIPVTEALPEEDEEVLVTVRFGGTKDVKPSVYVETASQISGTWTSYTDEYKVAPRKHHVIAWMPLPEPWKGE